MHSAGVENNVWILPQPFRGCTVEGTGEQKREDPLPAFSGAGAGQPVCTLGTDRGCSVAVAVWAGPGVGWGEVFGGW